MELTEAADDPLLKKEQLGGDGKQHGDEDKADVELKLSLRVSRLSNINEENLLPQETMPFQETSSLASVDEAKNTNKKGTTNIEELILPSDIDVNPDHKEEKSLEKLTNCVNEVYSCLPSLPSMCQIIGKLLDYVGTPLHLQCIAMYLMVDGEEANADLIEEKHETTKPDQDSGIHSNASEGPKQVQPRKIQDVKNIPLVVEELQDLLVDGVSGNEEGGKTKPAAEGCGKKEEGERNHREFRNIKHDLQNQAGNAERIRKVVPTDSNSSTGQLRAYTSFSKIPIQGRLTGVAGMAHVPMSSKICQRVQSGHQEIKHPPVANRLPIVSLDKSLRRFEGNQQRSTYQGISCGTKEELFEFVQNIGMAAVNTGIILEKYKDVFGMRAAGNILTEGQDYDRIKQFQAGKDVFLCRSRKTGRYFVTKQVPVFHEDFQSERQDQMKGKYSLYRPQQVDLVVAFQDSCPWDGLAIIYGLVKRKLRGKEFGEMFMEYCEANTLYHNIRDLESLDIRAHLHLAQKLLDIVQYLHDQDIIHGDLKLENIGMRADGLAVIDFEGAKHPSYKMNTRGTIQYMPPWFRKCYVGQRFDLLKTWDMWGVGMILLRIRYRQFLFGKEYASLGNNGVCHDVKRTFLELIEDNYDIVKAYLPQINPRDGPLEKRLACLIHGLLAAYGPEAQFTAEQARDALHEGNVVVQILKNGKQTIAPLVVQHGMKMKHFIHLPFIQKLKQLHDELADGMWFSCERQTPHGYRNTNVDLNQSLTECCVLQVHPALPHPAQAPVLAQTLAPFPAESQH